MFSVSVSTSPTPLETNIWVSGKLLSPELESVGSILPQGTISHYLQGLLKHRECFTSNQCLGNPDAAGPGPHFENHWPMPQSLPFPSLLLVTPFLKPPPIKEEEVRVMLAGEGITELK